MQKIEVKRNYFQSGEALVDLDFQVEIKFLDDDNSEKFVYEMRGYDYIEMGIATKSVFTPFEKEEDCYEFAQKYIIESYDSIDDIKESRYYDLLNDVHYETDKYINMVYDELDDTKYFGPRCGGKFTHKGLTYFIESCSHINATDKYYYIQVELTNGKYHYSVTEKSVFLRMQLNDMYRFYYDDIEVPYLINSDNIDDLEKIDYMKEDALKDKEILDEFIMNLEHGEE